MKKDRREGNVRRGAAQSCRDVLDRTYVTKLCALAYHHVQIAARH